jgi:hypothetical protein
MPRTHHAAPRRRCPTQGRLGGAGAPDDGIQAASPAGAPRARCHGGEHDQPADRHLPRRRGRQPHHQLGDAERHGHEQSDGEAVQVQRVADGQREEHPEHHRRASLERRADRRSHRHLHHHDGRQRAEHRVRHLGDGRCDPPRQPGRQPGLGHRADLGRRRGRPRHRVEQALPGPPDSAVQRAGGLRHHGRASLPPSGHDGGRRTGAVRRSDSPHELRPQGIGEIVGGARVPGPATR